MAGRVSILFIVAFLVTHAAAAQPVVLAPSNPKHWDAALSIGWLGGNKDAIAERWNDWYDTFATSVDVGRYWTPQLKTEARVTATTRGEVYVHDQVAVPGQPFPVFFSREHSYSLTAVDVSAQYQFFDNTWIHPFLGAGVQLAWERHSVETPFIPTGRDGRPLVPPVADEPRRTTFDPRPFVSGGAKFYVGERGFIRTDLSAAFDDKGVTRMWWRLGAGVDF